jgi:hypothetical protein
MPMCGPCATFSNGDGHPLAAGAKEQHTSWHSSFARIVYSVLATSPAHYTWFSLACLDSCCALHNLDEEPERGSGRQLWRAAYGAKCDSLMLGFSKGIRCARADIFRLEGARSASREYAGIEEPGTRG